ncbi:MAG TPA: glutamine amidotransferase [Candidatus Acidoferrum sp.]|nr:glutamine amidotransferase [Candidatus Acidoferrum sp.]
MKPLLFIKTGYAIKGIPAELKDFEHWTRDAAGLTDNQFRTVTVIDGETLPDPREHAGVVISGSAAMVSDRHAWSEYTAQWLLQAMERQVPILGICYGHQLLAHALGGVVDYHPRGREMGTKLIHTAPAARNDELFRHVPERFPAHVTHMQSVMRLPKGAEVLAWNSFEAHHAVRFAPRTWGVQFHPEFTTDAMTHYLRIRSDALAREGQNPQQLLAEVTKTQAAADLLRRFVELSAPS